MLPLRRVFLLRGGDGFIDLRRNLGAHFLQAFAIEQSLFDDQLSRRLQQRILRERLAFDVVADVTGIVVFAVTGETQSRRDHQLRRTTGARAFHRGADHIETTR